jgi:hypothetical protein
LAKVLQVPYCSTQSLILGHANAIHQNMDPDSEKVANSVFGCKAGPFELRFVNMFSYRGASCGPQQHTPLSDAPFTAQ